MDELGGAALSQAGDWSDYDGGWAQTELTASLQSTGKAASPSGRMKRVAQYMACPESALNAAF